jgi:hypothetical protein
LKPEWWGSPLVQEEKYQENLWKENIIIIIITTIYISSNSLEFEGLESKLSCEELCCITTAPLSLVRRYLQLRLRLIRSKTPTALFAKALLRFHTCWQNNSGFNGSRKCDDFFSYKTGTLLRQSNNSIDVH